MIDYVLHFSKFTIGWPWRPILAAYFTRLIYKTYSFKKRSAVVVFIKAAKIWIVIQNNFSNCNSNLPSCLNLIDKLYLLRQKKWLNSSKSINTVRTCAFLNISLAYKLTNLEMLGRDVAKFVSGHEDFAKIKGWTCSKFEFTAFFYSLGKEGLLC